MASQAAQEADVAASAAEVAAQAVLKNRSATNLQCIMRGVLGRQKARKIRFEVAEEAKKDYLKEKIGSLENSKSLGELKENLKELIKFIQNKFSIEYICSYFTSETGVYKTLIDKLGELNGDLTPALIDDMRDLIDAAYLCGERIHPFFGGRESELKKELHIKYLCKCIFDKGTNHSQLTTGIEIEEIEKNVRKLIKFCEKNNITICHLKETDPQLSELASDVDIYFLLQEGSVKEEMKALVLRSDLKFEVCSFYESIGIIGPDNKSEVTYDSFISNSLDCSIYGEKCNFPTLYLAGGQEMVPIVGSNPPKPKFDRDEGLFRVWEGKDWNYTANKFVEANAGKNIDTMLKPLLKRYCKFIKIGGVDRGTMIQQINFCIQIAKEKCLGSINLAIITKKFIEISKTLMFSEEEIAKEMDTLIKNLRDCDSPVHVANFLEESRARETATDVAMSGLDLD